MLNLCRNGAVRREWKKKVGEVPCNWERVLQSPCPLRRERVTARVTSTNTVRLPLDWATLQEPEPARTARPGHCLTLGYLIFQSLGFRTVVWFMWLCSTPETDVRFSSMLWENCQFKQNCTVLTKLSRPFRNYVTSYIQLKQLWIISQLSFLSFYSSATVAPFFPIWRNLINILYPY